MYIIVFIVVTQLLSVESLENKVEDCLKKLTGLIEFVENKFYEFNFDGLFGIILAQGKNTSLVACIKKLSYFM